MKKNPDAPLELDNLKNDPSEKDNVAGQHPDVVSKLEAVILRERDKPENKKFQFGKYRNRDVGGRNGKI